jgi:hypothetical protein
LDIVTLVFPIDPVGVAARPGVDRLGAGERVGAAVGARAHGVGERHELAERQRAEKLG